MLNRLRLLKIHQFGPRRDHGGPFIGKGPPKSASPGQFRVHLGAHEGSLSLGEVQK